MNPRTIPYPGELLGALPQEPHGVEAEARLLLALQQYETGRLSTGLAAQLAGVPRSAFFLLGQCGPFPFGEDADEVAKDVAHARQARHPQ